MAKKTKKTLKKAKKLEATKTLKTSGPISSGGGLNMD